MGLRTVKKHAKSLTERPFFKAAVYHSEAQPESVAKESYDSFGN
jgi:hypothetical protein